jgi:hypothetical protein
MSQAFSAISDLLRLAETDQRQFPATLLYEEGWMLRLVLDWFARTRATGHDLSFAQNARWYSEALLASAFLPRYRGDKLAEGYTHADGVIGHFDIGQFRQAELSLRPDARQFVVVEAKMFSGLSKGTTRAPNYNQAARNVACIAEAVRRANVSIGDLSAIGFFVIAPREQIGAGVFSPLLNKEALKAVVEERASAYDLPKTEWYQNAFLPVLDALRVSSLAWEDVIDFIKSRDQGFGEDIGAFYGRCLKFNRFARDEPVAAASIGKA